jgi:hypothetical protein
MLLLTALIVLPVSSSADPDLRYTRLCGPHHVNEAASAGDVHANADGFYVASLSEQLRPDDPRILVTTDDAFYLCTRSAATPAMDATTAILLMRERTVKHLFVPYTATGPSGY